MSTDTEIKTIWADIEAAEKARAESMPTEKEALGVMHEAYCRLKQLGFSEAMYCPKDGTVFDSISAGGKEVRPCHYQGKWPDGTFWLHEGSNLWPQRPILYRPIKEDE